MEMIFERLYFGLQAMRGGVRREMVRQAQGLLDASRQEIHRHVSLRLKEVFGRSDDPIQWLTAQLPSSRAVVQSRLAEAVATSGTRGLEKRKTSGSTGAPFTFYRDKTMTAWMDAAMWAAYSWHGITPGSRQARFWGMPLGRFPRLQRRVTDFIQHRRRLDAFAATPERCKQFFEESRRFRVEYAYGYPTLLRVFAENCEAMGLKGGDLGLRRVICTGELLAPEARRALAAFFACPIINEYGCTESGLLSIECEVGTPHVVPFAAYPEVVTSDGCSVRPGEIGEVVVTDLFGHLAPLLRYRLNDRAMQRDGSCRCGRSLPFLHVENGRVDSFILTLHRGPVYDAILAYTVPPEVARFRATQVALDRLEVVIVPGARFRGDESAKECKRRWETELGPGMQVEVRVVEEIPFDPSGKLRYFVPISGSGPSTPIPAGAIS
jgi:phenylacetate-coenzyme A ligase PaaK-like adenylate-forming protein